MKNFKCKYDKDEVMIVASSEIEAIHKFVTYNKLYEIPEFDLNDIVIYEV